MLLLSRSIVTVDHALALFWSEPNFMSSIRTAEATVFRRRSGDWILPNLPVAKYGNKYTPQRPSIRAASYSQREQPCEKSVFKQNHVGAAHVVCTVCRLGAQ